MSRIFRSTRSVCPVCLNNLPAVLAEDEKGRIFLRPLSYSYFIKAICFILQVASFYGILFISLNQGGSIL